MIPLSVNRKFHLLSRLVPAVMIFGLVTVRTTVAQDFGQVATVQVFACAPGYEGPDPYADCTFLVTDTFGVADGVTYYSDASGSLVLPVSTNSQGLFYFVVRIDYDHDGYTDAMEIDPAWAPICTTDEGPVANDPPPDTQIPFPFAMLVIENDLDISCDFFVDPITSDSPLAQRMAEAGGEPIVELPNTGTGSRRPQWPLPIVLVSLPALFVAALTLSGPRRRVKRF